MILIVVLISTLILSIALCIWTLYIRYTRKYSKSRFAFASLAAQFSLCTLIVTSIMAGETPFQTIMWILSKSFGWEYEPKEISAGGLVTICFVTFLFTNAVRSIFKEWDGPQTIEDKHREDRQLKSGIIINGFREAARILLRQPSPPIFQPHDIQSLSCAVTLPESSLAWHEQSRELMKLRFRSLDFSEVDGWHEQECCWFGKNLRTNQTVCLGCSLAAPSTEQLENFVGYLMRMKDQHAPLAPDHWWLYRGDGISQKLKLGEFEICCESENSVLDALVDFTDYTFDIKQRVERNKLPESELCVMDVYVEATARVDASRVEGLPISVEFALGEWLRENSNRQIALLGEYGQGKSTCALMFAYNLIRDPELSKRRMPILIELRGKAPSTMSPEELLATWAIRFRIDPKALIKLLIAGRILLILDGFDEMAFIAQEESRLAHFRTIWQLAYPGSKVLITGRPNFFQSEEEKRACIGERESVPGRPYCDSLHLEPLSYEQITNALRPHPEYVQNEILSLTKSNVRFRDLASRPCLLYIIGILWDKRREELKKNVTSASTIKLFIDYSLERQSQKSQKGNDFMTLTTAERKFFMEGVAAYMLSEELANQMTIRELRGLVEILLEIIPDSINLRDSIMEEHQRKPLRLRIGEDDVLLEALQTDVRTYGLLVNDPSKLGAIQFAHKSFMEYLAASVIARGTIDPDDLSSAVIRNRLNIDVLNIDKNRETILFFSETLESSFEIEGEKRGEQLATRLLELLIPSMWARTVCILRCNESRTIRACSLQRQIERLKGEKDEQFADAINRLTILLNIIDPDGRFSKKKAMYVFVCLNRFLALNLLIFRDCWSLWENCCFELGVTPVDMSLVTSESVRTWFEYRKMIYSDERNRHLVYFSDITDIIDLKGASDELVKIQIDRF